MLTFISPLLAALSWLNEGNNMSIVGRTDIHPNPRTSKTLGWIMITDLKRVRQTLFNASVSYPLDSLP
jgi:hypothetical protein